MDDEKKLAWAGNLYVLKDYRRQGIGGVLWTDLLNRMRQGGATCIGLSTFHFHPIIPYYKRCGFVEEHSEWRQFYMGIFL